MTRAPTAAAAAAASAALLLLLASGGARGALGQEQAAPPPGACGVAGDGSSPPGVEEAGCDTDTPALLQLVSTPKVEFPHDSMEDITPVEGEAQIFPPLTDKDILNLTYSPSHCIYHNSLTPCFYFQQDRWLDAWGRAEKNVTRLSLVQELELPHLRNSLPVNVVGRSKESRVPLPGSLHEFAQDPLSERRLYLTMQSPVATLAMVEYMDTFFTDPNSEDEFFSQDYVNYRVSIIGDQVAERVLVKLKLRGLERSVLKHSGLHAMHFCPLYRSREGKPLAFVTLQFLDAIGVFDPSTMTLVDIHFFPCLKYNLKKKPDHDGEAYGLSPFDCAGPHTLAADTLGNWYIAMKSSGGMAVLQNPSDCSGTWACWDYYPLAPGAIPFYVFRSIDRESGAEYIYFNDVNNSIAGVFNVSDGQMPPAAPLLVNLSKNLSGGANLRPGAGIGLSDGAALFVLYSEKGAMAYVSPEGTAQFIYLHTEAGQRDELAYLHICAAKADLNHSKLDIAVLSSSNDFPFHGTRSSVFNPDMVRQIRNVDPVGIARQNCQLMGTSQECEREERPNCKWFSRSNGTSVCYAIIPETDVETWASPTQNSWFHRVDCIKYRRAARRQESRFLVLATELRTNRLFVRQTARVASSRVREVMKKTLLHKE